MNFVFEDIATPRNFVNHWVMNKAGSTRFTLCPFYNRMSFLRSFNRSYEFISNDFRIDNRPKTYLIPIGVNNDPVMWTGGKHSADSTIPSLFEFINETFLKDLRNGNAYLLIDSSFEGYHDDWVFDFFHNECIEYDISPNQIFFVTGNSIIKERYDMWLQEKPQKINIHVIPYSHFESDVFSQSIDMTRNGTPLNTFEEHYQYKIYNNDKIKLFNNLNKKPREHRIWFYAKLYYTNLLSRGLVSMNQFDDPERGRYFCGITMDNKFTQELYKTLPSVIYDTSNEIHDPNYYVVRIHEKPHLDSWVSVISEAQYEDKQGTVFLSEKIFKPMTCYHPFIVMGNRFSLRELKKLGYETFSNWFDESYDEMEDTKRINEIVKVLYQIDKIENKLSMYRDMEKTLKHNFEVLRHNAGNSLPYPYSIIKKELDKNALI